jgi:hypothetical protein
LVLIVVGLLLLDGVLSGTASATTLEECRIQLGHLRTAEARGLQDAADTPFGIASLAMLDKASRMMNEGKNADAVQTLTDWVAEGHVSSGVQGITDCINAIGTPYHPNIQFPEFFPI